MTLKYITGTQKYMAQILLNDVSARNSYYTHRCQYMGGGIVNGVEDPTSKPLINNTADNLLLSNPSEIYGERLLQGTSATFIVVGGSGRMGYEYQKRKHLPI